MSVEHFIPVLLQFIFLIVCVLFKKGAFWFGFTAYNLTFAVVAVVNNYEGLVYPFIITFTLISLYVSWVKAFEGDLI